MQQYLTDGSRSKYMLIERQPLIALHLAAQVLTS